MRSLPGRFATNTHPVYEVIREISAGGMGFIIHVKHRQVGQEVVLKFILAQDASTIDLERFQRESLLLASLNHPNIVKIHSSDTEQGVPYLTMEFVRASSLKDFILDCQRHGEQPDFSRVCEMFHSLASAINYCHSHGILHRDLKPENVLIEEKTDRVVLVDFGVAKQLNRLERSRDESYQLTQTGELLGTPAYMSPEQIHGEGDPIGPPADIWGLVATLYHVLTLESPFEGKNALALMMQILNKPAPLLSKFRPEAPNWLHHLCAHGFKKDPEQRPSAEDIVHAFTDPDLDALKPRSNRVPLIMSLLLVFGVVAAIYWAALTTTTDENGQSKGQTQTGQLGKTKPKDEPPPILFIDGLEEGCVLLKPGMKSGGSVKNASKLSVSFDGVDVKVVPNQDGRFTIPISFKSKPISVTIKAMNEEEVVTQSYLLALPQFKSVILCRKLFDRLEWNKTEASEQDKVIERVGKVLGPLFQFVETKDYNCNKQRHRIATFQHRKTGIRFQLLPGGTFQFGSTELQRTEFGIYLSSYPYDNDKFKKPGPWKPRSHEAYTKPLNKSMEREPNNVPQTIPPFLLGQYELSTREWNCQDPCPKADSPKIWVKWGNLNRKLVEFGGELRLPSEVEWEYACRGGTRTHFFWGDKFKLGYSWILENTEKGKPKRTKHPLIKPNSFGLFSMTGNVWEWCSDVFYENWLPTSSSEQREASSLRVIRGGSSKYLFPTCRSAYRDCKPMHLGFGAVGARLSRNLFSDKERDYILKNSSWK